MYPVFSFPPNFTRRCVHVLVFVCGMQREYVRSTQITAYLFLQTWTQLNHINVTLSYDAILK